MKQPYIKSIVSYQYIAQKNSSLLSENTSLSQVNHFVNNHLHNITVRIFKLYKAIKWNLKKIGMQAIAVSEKLLIIVTVLTFSNIENNGWLGRQSRKHFKWECPDKKMAWLVPLEASREDIIIFWVVQTVVKPKL